MSETKKDIREQLKYMRENKASYLDPKNPNKITETEFNHRIKLLQNSLKMAAIKIIGY